MLALTRPFRHSISKTQSIPTSACSSRCRRRLSPPSNGCQLRSSPPSHGHRRHSLPPSCGRHSCSSPLPVSLFLNLPYPVAGALGADRCGDAPCLPLVDTYASHPSHGCYCCSSPPPMDACTAPRLPPVDVSAAPCLPPMAANTAPRLPPVASVTTGIW